MMLRMRPVLRVCAMTCVLFLLAAVPGVGAQPRDAIEGRWLGEAGFDAERVVTGVEFRRNDRGEIVATLYQPVGNAFGLPLPGAVVREGGRYVNAKFEMSLALTGDRLDGTFGSVKIPITLHRTDALPGEVPVPDAPTGPGPRWRTKLGAPIYAGAAVRDGIAYVGSTGGVFHAVRIADGGLAWTFDAGRPMYGEALATAGSVYFVCDNGFLYKLDRGTGHETWRHDLGDARVARVLPHTAVFDYDYHAPRPLLANGVVYVGSGDGALYAVDDATGQRVWRFATGDKVRVGAVLAGDNVIAGSLDGKVYAVDARSGRQAWMHDLRAPVTTVPALIDGKVIVGTRGSVLYALDPAKGEVLWRDLFWLSWVESEAVGADGVLYIGSSDLRRASAIDPRDGHVRWRSDVYGSPWGRPALTARHLYVGAVGTDPYFIRHVGSLVALDRDSGRTVWRWPVPANAGALQTGFVASPAIEGDTLVIGGLDGTLYGFAVD
jgi:outer membrane protein assembly factor BamB